MGEYLCETLALGGYGSLPSGAAALGWMASANKPVDLLLSDVKMPGMSGLDLLRTAKAVSPELPLILESALAIFRSRGALFGQAPATIC